jgi:YhcN/YlaJ family sporulation lipoprotein
MDIPLSNRKERVIVKIICLMLLLLSLLIGCSQAPKQGAASSPSSTQNGIKAQQAAPSTPQIKDSRAVADHLEKLATSIPLVQSAHCVVFGNTAVVGINLRPELDRSRVGTVKYAVAEALRKDPYGANAIVTADMDLDQRLRDISSNVRSGRPVAAFSDEMADIIGRIIPQLPRDVDTQTSPPPVSTDANKAGRPSL